MLAPDTTLQGRYRVVRQLGRGGMGTVYEAKALRLNATVALKETHFTEERLRKQFEREAQLLANLRHPALPRVIDHFDESDGLYLVMDFVEGDDLWEMLKKRGAPFPTADVLKWAVQLLDALEYLHTQRPPVIHRDIKPQNLKLADGGRLMLLDFGLAKGLSDAAQSLLSSRTVMGFSLPYAPLEQILQLDESSREQLSVLNPQEVERIRRSGTDRRSDLYSAGATLLHLLTARVPTSSLTRAVAVWSNQPDPLENALAQGIPESLRSFLRRSMYLDPGWRFGSAAEMRKALRDASEGANLAVTVLDSPPGLRTRRPNDPPRSSFKPETSHDSTTRPSPRIQASREDRGRRKGLLAVAAGVAFVAISMVAFLAVFFVVSNSTAVVNANMPAPQTPSPMPSPSDEPYVPLTEVSERPPVNSTPDANGRDVPVNPTPTPRTVTPQPQATPTPTAKQSKPVDAGQSEEKEISKIDQEIVLLERRRAALLANRPQATEEINRIGMRLAFLKRRRALLELAR